VVEVDADGDQHDKDHCDDPVNDQAERRPPVSVSNILAVLPQVLEPMAGEAGHQQPGRPGDARRGDLRQRLRRCRPRRRARLVVPHLVALVRAGARFDKGVLVERPDEVREVAA
jgi:hypothetical protein